MLRVIIVVVVFVTRVHQVEQLHVKLVLELNVLVLVVGCGGATVLVTFTEVVKILCSANSPPARINVILISAVEMIGEVR